MLNLRKSLSADTKSKEEGYTGKMAKQEVGYTQVKMKEKEKINKHYRSCLSNW